MTVTDPTPGTVQDEAATAGTGETLETTTPMVEEELLVEEISIDGMCGVY
jgi:mycofactocin precursor